MNSRVQQSSSDELTARFAALELLDNVLGRKQQLDVAMAGSRRFPQLEGHDRAFAMHLVLTCLRRLGQIDDLIDTCLQKPLPFKALSVRHSLRLGITQLLFSETAAHAAVSTTVDMCRATSMEGYAKLTNAIMRRIQREGEGMLNRQDVARLNTPEWLWSTWCDAYGAETATAIAQQHLAIAPVDLSVKEDIKHWAEILGGEVVLGESIRLSSQSDVTALPGFKEGAWWVQDAAARLTTLFAGDVKGKTVFDLCAAPGGKTLSLCAQGADVTAVDISEKRLKRLRENLTRTGLNAQIVCADIREWQPNSDADVVILDAPCSATGTIRRHPDLPYLKSADDVTKLSKIQHDLLEQAAKRTKSGGLLLYVTCSLQEEEGPDRISAFLADAPSFTREPIQPNEVSGLADAITENGDLRTLPHFLSEKGGIDGFYVARLRKSFA